MKKILIITSSFDLTVDYIINKFSDKAQLYRLNTDYFGEYEIIISQNKGWEINSKYWSLKQEEVFSIYYRKPTLPKLEKYDNKYHSIIFKEMMTTIYGILDVFKGRVLSNPFTLRRAENKITQLMIAKKIGFELPNSLITNSSKAVKRFCSYKSKQKIVKPLSVGKITYDNSMEYIQTNLLNPNIPMENLEFTPAYFQDYVEKEFELRITVIDKKIYPVKIETDEKIDWRKKGSNNNYSIVDIPLDIKYKCIKMLEIFNLKFGAFDFIFRDNQYVFLELNPNGQWYWLEENLKLDISDSIFKYLEGTDE